MPTAKPKKPSTSKKPQSVQPKAAAKPKAKAAPKAAARPAGKPPVKAAAKAAAKPAAKSGKVEKPGKHAISLNPQTQAPVSKAPQNREIRFPICPEESSCRADPSSPNPPPPPLPT